MREKKRTHHDLAELATAQHGVVSARQLRRLGYLENRISADAARGRLRRIHRGVYAVGHEALTWNGECMAAVLANMPALASHWTAARLWGLVASTGSNFHLTAPSRRHRRPRFIVHFARLVSEDVVEVKGIPLTSLARTILDLAALVDADRLARLLESAEKLTDEEGRGLFDLRDFESLLARCGGHPGRRPLDKALRAYRPELATLRSDLERDFRRLLRKAGIPLPAANYVVDAYELDCYWERERFCVELDVFFSHGSRRSFEKDREREEELLMLGVEVMRVTDVRLEREPQAVVARVAAHLARRRRTLAFN